MTLRSAAAQAEALAAAVLAAAVQEEALAAVVRAEAAAQAARRIPLPIEQLTKTAPKATAFRYRKPTEGQFRSALQKLPRASG